MITQNEISSLNLSPTKKDFVQIWNELIEVASKITERWDPTSTNESDPGIVLLKVLAGIADKLNYNIDKNILEAFMPTAAQMESMRKLCELVGYDIKYYQSAETKVRISYTGNTTDLTETNDEKLPDSGLYIPRFTTITNADKDITFVTTNAIPVVITNTVPWVEVPCIEGQISQCESTNENNLITLSQLDDNNRYYLPEIQIAENGIFVHNAVTVSKNGEAVLADGDSWQQVSNLNTQPSDTRIFKFGYDSLEGRPYLAFPDDVSSLIGDGLFIYFIRTSGQSGNISPRTLEVLEIPVGEDWDKHSAEQFEVVNVDATTNGANIESISAAYNNFKKTVGTFDTLVTCRDYMNKIYSLMDASNYPYVSNILVTDIRNDINNAITLCSCNEFGILYKETPLLSDDRSLSVQREVKPTSEPNIYKLFVNQNTDVEIPLIDHFDLLLYPFKTFTQVSSGTKDLVTPYNKSFTYTEQMNNEIEASLAEFKTCAHRLTTPADGSIVAINNYLRLNALIATSTKVSEVEAKSILQNVKVALVNEFNLRNLDFGEEIPFDSILSVIENADSRIKVVSLQEPTVLTTYSVKERVDGNDTSKEYGIASTANEEISGVTYDDSIKTAKGETAKDIYNKLVLRNILAGRASLFNYDETFISNNSEKPYTITTEAVNYEGDFNDYPDGESVLDDIGPKGGVLTLVKKADGSKVYETYTPYPSSVNDITRVEATCEISNENGLFENVKLAKNEVIKFRAPNLITTKTFPAYVYYRFEKGTSGTGGGVTNDGRYAEAKTLVSFITNLDEAASQQDNIKTFFTKLWSSAPYETFTYTFTAPGAVEISQLSRLETVFNTSIIVGTEDEENFFADISALKEYLEDQNAKEGTKITFKYYQLMASTMSIWGECIRHFNANLPGDTTLWRLSSTSSYPKGKFVTGTHQRLFAQSSEYLVNSRVGYVTYICTDLGEDPVYYMMSENSDIELQPDDKLYIHYTPSSTNEDGETVNAEPVSVVYTGSSTEPIILKPSGFTLIPSDDVNRQGTSWKKTDVDFNGEKKNLLALAPNEQIEMRSLSRVVLDSPARFYKNFNNSELENGDINNVISYELKDGEYIFYTDQNTQEAAYYGSGSVITLDKGAYIPRATEPVEISQILEQGLHIVPWSSTVLLNTNRKITITEYQYITLVDGDILNTLTIDTTDSDSTDKGDYKTGGYTINNTRWRKCDPKEPITYTAAGAETSTTLPKIALTHSPSTTWEVCSFLELSTSPGYSQQLRAVKVGEEADSETNIGPVTASINNKITVYSRTGTGENLVTTIEPKQTSLPNGVTKFEPVSIKLSTLAQVASGNLKIDTDSNGETDSNTTHNVQLKIFKEEAPSKIKLDNTDDTITPISSKESIPVESSIATVNNYWSKIDIRSELWRADPGNTNKPMALKLNFMIPEDDMFGIFSIYLEVPEDRNEIPAEGSRVFIDIPKEFGSYENVISIFNYKESIKKNNTDETPTTYYWWSNGVDPDNTSRLYLRAGLNCIKIAKSCSLLIKAEENADGSILYDNMRLVKGSATNGINLDLLKFKNTSTVSAQSEQDEQIALATAVLDGIKALDKNHEFYYNVPVENSTAIEFDDNNVNSFDSPYTLYDINNVNNSFVVSKLDVAYLDKGLKIAKSSRY